MPLMQVAMSNLYRVQCSRCIAKLFSSTPRALVLCYFFEKTGLINIEKVVH